MAIPYELLLREGNEHQKYLELSVCNAGYDTRIGTAKMQHLMRYCCCAGSTMLIASERNDKYI